MKPIFTTSIILVFFTGCGLMDNPKGEDTESKKIHVPQKITIEIPTILKKSTNETQTKKIRKSSWYN